MRKGPVDELYFESLPGYVVEVMIPAVFTRTTSTVMAYIERHFEVDDQKILKAEFVRDKEICDFKGRLI